MTTSGRGTERHVKDRRRRLRGTLLVGLTTALCAVSVIACRESQRGGSKDSGAGGALQHARVLLEQGDFDGALAKSLDPSADAAEALCLQGQIWAKKAERAPLPSVASDDGTQRPPEFKPEELRAIDLFERARAARPTLGEAYLGLANVLAPHAVRRFELVQASRRGAAGRGSRVAAPPPPPGDAPDFTIGRVVGLYQEAVKNDPEGMHAVEELERFAARVKDVDAAAWAHAAGLARDRENPDRLVQYGDFLHKERGDRHGAIENYRQALIWRPDDTATRTKLAALYIELGREHLAAQQWGAAKTMFDEARKYVKDVNSPQGMQIQAGLDELANIRPAEGR